MSRFGSAGTLSMIKRSGRYVGLALAAAGATGCAVGPDFHKPEAPSGAGYTTSPLPDIASSNVPGGDTQRFVIGQDVPYKWWEAFGSPAIDSLGGKGVSQQSDHQGCASRARAGARARLCTAGIFLPDHQRGLQFRAAETRRKSERQQRSGCAGERLGHFRVSKPLAGPASAQRTAVLQLSHRPIDGGLHARRFRRQSPQSRVSGGAGPDAALRVGGDLHQPGRKCRRRSHSRSVAAGANLGNQGNHRGQREIAGRAARQIQLRLRHGRSMWRLKSCSSRRPGRCCRLSTGNSSRTAI